MKYIENWDMTKNRFEAWWNRSNIDRPLMKVIAKREKAIDELEPVDEAKTPEEFYLYVDQRVKKTRNFYKTHRLMADAFPSMNMDIGPGSMAAYLGAEPIFSWQTVWFQECIQSDWAEWGEIRYDPENYWWKRHLALVWEAQELAQGDFLINIPDIVENIDILSALRGSQALCYDLMDQPEFIKESIDKIDDLYFKYYNQFYDIVKGKDNSSSYTSFGIWGAGKAAAIQCDFSAMISPDQFREFIQPSLRKQCQVLDRSLYHLDGTHAMKHVDALMEIEELDALQWTPDAGAPDAANERYFLLYDKVRNAGKSLWVDIYDGGVQEWIESADKLIARYGPNGMYLHFPIMEEADAVALIKKAEKDWK